ncbi:MAG: tyrosine protein phosphatase [Thermoleophilaceae bacterium]
MSTPVAGRCELHFHLLPGVDDGPRDMREALELARLAVEDGTSRIVATPHVREVRVAELPMRVAEVRDRIEAAGLPLKVEVGGEIARDDVERLSQSDLETLAHGRPGSSWVLIEAPLRSPVDLLHDATDMLRQRGFGVVLAHPERCAGFFLDGGRPLARELEAGSRLLLNASSIVGGHGSHAEARAFELLRHGAVTAIASDAHSRARPPRLGQVAATLEQCGFPAEQVELWTDGAPCRLLEQGFRATGA